MFSLFLRVDQFCVQQGNVHFHHGNLVDLHGNFVGLLHSEKSVALHHIRTHHGCNHPLVCQRGLSSPPLHLSLDIDPIIKDKINLISE